MKGTLLSMPKQVFFFLYAFKHWSGVTEIFNVAPPAHALTALQVRLMSVSNQGHFTLEVGTVFHPYVPWTCSGVIQIYCMTHSVHAPQAVQFMVNSVSNKGHFPLRPKQFLLLSLLALQWRDLNILHGTPCVCITSSAS
jgi:hypothetical protein